MTVATHDAPPVGLAQVLRDAAPLLAALALLMAGNGLTGTLLGVRAGLEGFGVTITGMVLAGYYAGFLIGSVAAPSTIVRVGHVRVFAGLASLASAAVLIHVVWRDPAVWFVLRVVSGMCMSALYVVTETWLNGAATNRTRGSLLASYMVVVSGGLLAGQFLYSMVDPRGFGVFVLASVLVSLAVLPVSLATVSVPAVFDPTPMSLRELVAVAPLAPVAAALSGFTAAAMIGAGAVYAVQAGLGQGGTASLIGAALAGGLVLQVPLGRWSDRIDRRVVIAATGLVASGLSVLAAMVGPDRLVLLILLVVLAGGAGFALYSLGNAHLNDYLESSLVVTAGARMVLVNGIGAVAGPIVGAFAIEAAGPGGLFVTLAAGYLVVALFAAWRITRRAAVEPEERSSFAPVPIGASPTVAIFGEGSVGELYPPQVGEFESDAGALQYREQGAGHPVVLVFDPTTPAGDADAVLPALAADGVRAIVPAVRATASTDDQVEDLLAVLRELDLATVAVVGVGRGADVVAHFAEHHPERLEALVLVGAEPGRLPEIEPLELDAQLLHDDADAFADAIVTYLRHR